MKNKKYVLQPIKVKKIDYDLEIKQNKNDDYSKTVEIREKRIGIIFKIIYVFAIFFATIFFDMSMIFKDGLNEIYIVETCIISFLLIVMLYMVFYIINEMKCLKINYESLPDDRKKSTEESYEKIFSSLKYVGIFAFVFTIIAFILKNYITLEFLRWTFIITLFIRFIISILKYKVLHIIYICEFFGMLCLVSLFFLITF